MHENDFYNTLEVSKDASLEVIRVAYFSLLKKYHPDSNKDPENSDKVIRLINLAYDTLSDPVKRKKYDMEYQIKKNTDNETKIKSEENSTLKERHFLYSEITPQNQKQIREIVFGNDKRNYVISHGGIGGYYVWTFFLAMWFFVLFFNASEYRWATASWFWVIIISVFVVYGISKNVFNILLWHTSPLKNYTVLTPIYFVQINCDNIHILPYWIIDDVRATHNYRNGFYSGTDINIKFTDKQEIINISSQKIAEEFLEKNRQNRITLFDCIRKKDYAYLKENDYFLGINNSDSKKNNTLSYKILASVFFIGTLVLFTLYLSNINKPPQNEHSPKQTQEEKSFNHPVVNIPTNGAEKKYDNETDLAPLAIVTSEGTFHHFIKIVDLNNDEVIKTIFIRAGKSIETKMPLGSYEIKYASGEQWYGEKYLFGPNTIYTKADESFDFRETNNGYSGYTVELILQRDGNLTTSSIPSSLW
jgi:hypothetical protein